MVSLKDRKKYIIPVSLAVVSAASLVAAYIAEYGFGLKPCVLCLYQRAPYVVVIMLSFMVIIFFPVRDLIKPLLLLSAIIFLVGAAIAFFHMGVEYHWWQGTSGCGGFGSVSGVEELRQKIISAPLTRCDEPAFIFLGLSMAGWNMLYSLGLVVACIYLFRKLKNA